LVQVTVVPALIGRVAGEKVKFASETALPEAVEEVVVADTEEQAVRIRTTSKTRITGTK
jgi:hypothetical protein